MLEINYKIDSSGAQRLLAAAPGKLHAALERWRDVSLTVLEADVKQNILTPYDGQPPAVAFGTLVDHVYGEALDRDQVVAGFVGVSPPADVYAAPVDTGARAHFPPVDALVPWVMKKFDIHDEKKAQSVAFLVARKISQKGTKGHFMFERAFAADQSKLDGIADAEIASALSELGGGN